MSEDFPDDTVGPYSTDTPTTFATRSEVYMAANGSHGNRYTLRDKLENVERGDIGGSSKLTEGKSSTTSIRTAISPSIATTVAAPGRT